jgi:tRNA-splicing ligase RtcB
MVEHAADYEWRGEGEGAEVVLYAPDQGVADSAFERVLHATRLPGVESPVYGVASPERLGWIVVSTSHAAPDLASVPVRGLLLVADAALDNLGVPPEEVPGLIPHQLSEVRVPSLTAAGIRRLCETGARAAAEDGLLEDEDLPLLDPLLGDADALARRAISAGDRDWDRLGDAYAYEVGEVLDDRTIESLGLNQGMFVLVVSAGAGELGRLALAGHRERIAARVRGGDFGAEEDLPAATAGTGEAADLLAALHAAANFADGRAALLVYALRRALGDVAGGLSLRAAWRVGGIEDGGGSLAHRRDLAVAGEGEVLASGGSVVAGTGKMSGSVPSFEAPEDGGGHLWEEAGLLERWAGLDPPEGKS